MSMVYTYADSQSNSTSLENTENNYILQYNFLDRHKLSDTWCFEITSTRQLPEHGWSLLHTNIIIHSSVKPKKTLPPCLQYLGPFNRIGYPQMRREVLILPYFLLYYNETWGWQGEISLTNPYTISPPAAAWCDGQVSTSRIQITNIINEARTRHQPSPALQLGELLQLLLNYY